MPGGSAKILVACHKPYWVPQDSLYVPVQVGAAGKDAIFGMQRDDEGADNISARNPHFNELTALYWGWKNLDADYLGLVHYRRYLGGSGERGILTAAELEALLAKAPVVLPKQRNYFIETIEGHYAHTFDQVHMEIARMALEQLAPDYLPAFNAHMAQTKAHILNMFVMRKDVLGAYCSWLFPLLDLIDAAIDYSGMTAFEERAVGRVAERLLDPWLATNGIAYVEVPVVGLEKTNWVKKGGGFLAAKFLGKGYRASF